MVRAAKNPAHAPHAPPDTVPRNSVVRAAVAAVIVGDGGRILLGTRRGPRGGGQLAMPGGAIDHGETILAAVEREVFEETGLIVKSLPYSKVQPELFVIDHVGETDHFVTLFVEARVVGGTLQNREPERCDGWEWLTFAQLAARVPREAIEAWQHDRPHEALCWLPLPHLSFYREHLGLN